VNQFYVPNKPDPVTFTPKDNKAVGLAANHSVKEWPLNDVMKSTEDHVVFTWGATDPMRKAAKDFKRGEGIYLYDYAGKKYIDFTSQAINNNLGYSIPPSVLEAITK
jgi:taurine--2-oxoglutarate transaminase